MSEVRRGPASPPSSGLSGHHHTSPQLLKQLTSPPVVSASSVAANLAALVSGSTGHSTPYVLTPSVSGRSSPSVSPCPARKKLKLDVEVVANVARNSSGRRKRLGERRQSKLQSVANSYKDNMGEWFFLQSEGNIVDLHNFRRKPTRLFLTFLTQNSAPGRVVEEVRARVLGPALLSQKVDQPPPSPPPPRSVSSAAMAAAITAKAAASGSPLVASHRSQPLFPPYTPRAAVMSPVRVGEQLTSYSGTVNSAGPKQRSSVFRDQLVEKVKQEAWVVKRVGELTREGLWSEKRLPKVCEKPRPRTQWDVTLQEMRWLAVDFYQERQWKKAAAKMLAESAKAYVESWEERRQKVREAKERRLRKVTGFVSGQVLSFWNDAASQAVSLTAASEIDNSLSALKVNHIKHTEENPVDTEESLFSNKRVNNSGTSSEVRENSEQSDLISLCLGDNNSDSQRDLSLKRRRMLNNLKSTLCVSSSDIEIGLLDDVIDDKDFSYNDAQSQDYDDESTIEAQELYESQYTLVDVRLEIDTLKEDNLRSLESLLRSEYPGYVPCSESEGEEDLDEDDDHIDTDSDESQSSDQEDEFSFEDVEHVIPLAMFPAQRKLYDDYLAGPDARQALEKGDAVTISNVVKNLRKICNHPYLVTVEDTNKADTMFNKEKSFLRVPDLSEVSKLVLTATDYDPYAEVDLGSLNLVFMQHETTLTAITFDRIRKCCAPRALIEELPDRPAPAPLVPRGRLNIDIHPTASASNSSPSSGRTQLIPTVNGQHIFLTSSPAGERLSEAASGKVCEPDVEAFHKDSLHVIARFNERRCMGMPLYGQDLLDALTVVDVVRPLNRNSRTRNCGQGYVNCLTAAAETWSEFSSTGAITSDRSLRLPWTWMSLGSSGKSRSHEKRIDFRHKTFALKQLVAIIEKQSQQIHSELSRDIFGCYSPLSLVRSESRTLRLLEDRLHPNLALVRQQQQVLGRLQSSTMLPTPCAALSPDPFRCGQLSVKLEKLDQLLRQFRSRGERAVVFCQMPEMLELLRCYFNSRQFLFTYIESDASLRKRTTQLQWFAERGNVTVLLLSTATPVAGFSMPAIDNVIFFDANWNKNSEVSYENGDIASLCVSPCLQWCRRLRSRKQHLNIFRLVCEGTVEDTITVKALQAQLLCDIKIKTRPENGSSQPVFTINRQTLEALFFSSHFCDNGIVTNNDDSHDSDWADLNKVEKKLMSDDVEAMAQLDWLWSSKLQQKLHNDGIVETTVAELSRHLDKELLDNELQKRTAPKLKPVNRYAVEWIQELLESDPSLLDDDLLIDPINFLDEEEEKRDWEERYQLELTAAQQEMAELEQLPLLTYSSEDSNRTWHGRDGQPMPLWTPPTPSMAGESDLIDHHISFLYKSRLMEESELPPIYVKKESTPPPIATSSSSTITASHLKRSASEAGFNTSFEMGSQTGMSPNVATSGDVKLSKYRKDEAVSGGQPLSGITTSSGGFAPRSLFERPQTAMSKSSKMRHKVPNRQLPPGVSVPTTPVPGAVPPPPTSPVIPGAINPVAGLRHPLPRPQVEAENVPEWLVQEDWALLYAVRELQELPVNLTVSSAAHTPNWDLVSDMVNSVSRCYRGPRQCRNRFDTIILPREEGRIYDMPPSAVAAMAARAAAVAAATNKKNKKKQSPSVKTSSSRPMKTSALFREDNNTAWSSLYATRFENIKAVANKRSPTTKPLVVNPSMKNSQHAAVLVESGISYDVPLNPIQVAANRADRIQREKQRTQQDQQQQLAQQRTAAAQAAAAQAAASAAQQQQTRIVTATIATAQQQQQQQQIQQQQTVVTSSPHPAGVVVGISQPMTTVNNAQINNVIHSRLQQQQQPQQLQQLRPTQQQTIGIQELVRVSSQQPQQHSTVVVSSQPASTVVSVASLTPSQLQAAQKLVGQAGTIKGGVVTAQGRALTPQQMNLLRQQAIMKKTAQDNAVAAAQAKARMQGMQLGGASSSGMTSGTITTSSVMTPQKVTVTGVSLAPSNLVTVVTQSGQPKTHFIRQVSTGPGGKSTTNIRTVSEADMKLLLATKQQQQLQSINSKGQVTQLQVPAQSNLAAQLLASGIHVQQHTGAGGAQVATLVKTVTASGSGGVAVVGAGGQVQPSVTIPVANVNLPQVKAALARSGVANTAQMQLALRQQIIQQQRKPVTTTLSGNQQKVTLGQVGTKGVPAQLIVSSSGNVSAAGGSGQPKQLQQQAVTVQQFQQIVKSVNQSGVSNQGGNMGQQQQIVSHSQQLLPGHAVFTKQAVVSTFAGGGTATGLITTGAATTQTSTVQARVIPVSSTSAAGRMQQIQVVQASPSQVQVVTTTAGNVRQLTAAAPNVTVDTSGRPTGTFINAAGTQHIRVATSGNQQFMTSTGQNVSVAVRGPVGVLATHHQQQQQHIVTSQHGVTKLQVVGPSSSASSQPADRS